MMKTRRLLAGSWLTFIKTWAPDATVGSAHGLWRELRAV
jgi:hypothetical protein